MARVKLVDFLTQFCPKKLDVAGKVGANVPINGVQAEE
jgi:hypothetical protein